MLPGRQTYAPAEHYPDAEASPLIASELQLETDMKEDGTWDEWVRSDPLSPRGEKARASSPPVHESYSAAPAAGKATIVGAVRAGSYYRPPSHAKTEPAPAFPVATATNEQPPAVRPERVVPNAASSEIVTAADTRHFFDQVTQWWTAQPEATVPSPQPGTEMPINKLDPATRADSEKMKPPVRADVSLEKRRAARQELHDRLQTGAYRLIDSQHVRSFAGENMSDRDEQTKWDRYQSTPLPKDEPLFHERMTKWLERTQTSREAKMSDVVQYLKNAGRMKSMPARAEGSPRQRLDGVLQGCGELLSSLKQFSLSSSVATYNIIGSASEALRTLSQRLEQPEQRRRVIVGVALGALAVGAVGVAALASRRGFSLADVMGGHEDKVTPRPRRLGMPLDVPTDTTVPTEVPMPQGSGARGIHDALNQSPAAAPSQAPTGEYAYPWDWARDAFGSDQATSRLHELAERAARDGHKVVWNNVGTAQEWIQIDNSSATDYVVKTLNAYA